MEQKVRYGYSCRWCGNSGETFFPDDSHEGDAATCSACCEPVTLARNDGEAPSWFEAAPTFTDAERAEWWHESVDAAEWCKPGKVAFPKEAALLLCGCNSKHSSASDPLSGVDESLRVAHGRLLENFTRVEQAAPKVNRTLADWWDIAKAGAFEYHPRIDGMMRAFGIESAATDRPKAKPLPRQRHQENEILRVIAELGYTATALPKTPVGKAGARAEVKKKLPEFPDSFFEKAWRRLRLDKRVVDGGDD